MAKRPNALHRTPEENAAIEQAAISKAINLMVAEQMALNAGRKELETKLFSELFKKADYAAGDVVLISESLRPAVDFKCSQIKYSNYLAKNEYIVTSRALTPKVIGQ